MKIETFPGTLSKSRQLGTPYALTKNQVDWLRRLYPKNSTEAIARIMGCSYNTVNRLAKNFGIYKDRAILSKRLSNIQKELVESERRRSRWGLPRRTRLHLPDRIYTKKELRRRWKAKKLGYITGDFATKRYVLYYNKTTTRNTKFEFYCAKAGFEVREKE